MGCDSNDVAKHQLHNQYQVSCPVQSNMGNYDSAYPDITDVMLHSITLQAVHLCLYLK